MRISSGGLVPTPLLRAYFGNSNGSSSSSGLSGSLNSDAIVSQLGDVKSKLFSLASKAKQLLERAEYSQSSQYTIQVPQTTVSTTTTDYSVSVSTNGGANDPQFDKAIDKAFNRAYTSENNKLLKNKNLSGEVSFTVTDGENTETFTIQVDSSTTLRKFAEEFNSKSGANASAKVETFEVDGSLRSRFRIEGSSITSSTTLIDEALEDTNGRRVSEAEAALFEQDIKKFVTGLNGLVAAVNGKSEGIAALEGDIGLLDSFADIVKNLKSDDGSTSLSALMSEKSSGGYSVNGTAIREAFVNNSEGVLSLIENLSDSISGNKGITQSYARYGGSLDQISSVVKLIGKTQTEYLTDGLSDGNENVQAQRQENIESLVNYASRLTAQKA